MMPRTPSLKRSLLIGLLLGFNATAASLGPLLITKTRPASTSDCTNNPAAATVSTLDSSVYAALPYSNAAGESLLFEWVAPSGSVYLNSRGSLGSGAGCQFATLTIDSSVSSLGGTWTVRVTVNNSIAARKYFTLVVNSAQKPRVLTAAVITRDPNPPGCASPDPVNSFTELDPTMNVWYLFSNGYKGQVTSLAWYNPSGGLEGRYQSQPLSSDGSFCSRSTLTLDNRTSRLYGNWKVVATYDGQAFFEVTVPLNDSRLVNVPFELRINQFISTACPQFTILASVRDKLNNAVTGLTAADFVLTEADGRTTPVQVSAVDDTPNALSLAIVIDSSGSLGADGLALEKSAARQLVDLLATRDAVGVWSFTSQVKQQIDFTTNHDSVRSAISGINDTGGTALYQAVAAGAQALRNRGTRRAIVLMTDGEDTEGGATLSSAIQAALGANTPIFTIGFGGSKPDVLTQMADQTGGFYSSSANKADLQRILFALGKALAGQYQITYTSRDPSIGQTAVVQVKSRGGSSNTHTITGIKPCAATAASGTLIADPATIILAPGKSSGQTRLIWTTTGVRSVWIRYASGTGTPITGGPLGPNGSTYTNDSVTEGDTFYLTDADTGKVLASVTVHTRSTPAPGKLTADPNPFIFCNDPFPARTYLSWNAPGYSSLTVRSGSKTGLAVAAGGATGGGPVNLLRPSTDFLLIDPLNNVVDSTTVNVSCQLPERITAPDAYAGRQYSWRWPVPIGSGRWLWSVSLDQPTSTFLPEGLTLDDDGTIHGVPKASSGGPLTLRLALQDQGITGQPTAVMLVTLNILDVEPGGTSYDTTIPLNAQWVVSSAGSRLPGDSIGGGSEPGHQLFVCRVRYRDNIYPGKTWGEGCYFGLDGYEWYAERYEVLTGSNDDNFWDRGTEGAFVGGANGGSPSWPVCRGEYIRNGESLGTHPGRYLPDGCHIGYGGDEIVLPGTVILHNFAASGAASTGTTLTITNKSMTAGLVAGPDSKPDFCAMPAPRSDFAASDDAAGIWFTFDRARPGDVLSIRWIHPAGSVDPWHPSAVVNYNGSGCYAWFLGIHGYLAGYDSGTWRAQLLVNGSVVFGLPFNIAPPAGEANAAPVSSNTPK